MQIIDTVAAANSATTTDTQMPFNAGEINKGKSNTAPIWKTRVRKNEIKAEIKPLFNAVKKPEPKIASPQNKN